MMYVDHYEIIPPIYEKFIRNSNIDIVMAC